MDEEIMGDKVMTKQEAINEVYSGGLKVYSSQNTKMERIMIQKWIALFPDGQEAWSEIRRTGYPTIVAIESNQSNGEVANGEIISRLKFPSSERSNNTTSNIKEAESLLGGRDVAGTRLWWDVKR